MGKRSSLFSETEMCVQSYDQKRLTALATLRAAEVRTGVKCQSYQRLLSLNRCGVAPVPAAVSQPAPLTSVVSQPISAPTVSGSLPVSARPAAPLPVQDCLSHLFPTGQLEPGSVISVLGSLALLLGFLSAASQLGTWVSFLGLPNLGVLAVQQSGVVLERATFVPDVGAQAPQVIAELLPAMVVVVGNGAVLSSSDRRRLAARARECGSVILTTQPWPGAHFEFQITQTNWGGLASGCGRVQSCFSQFRRVGRGVAVAPRKFGVELPLFTLSER